MEVFVLSSSMLAPLMQPVTVKNPQKAFPSKEIKDSFGRLAPIGSMKMTRSSGGLAK